MLLHLSASARHASARALVSLRCPAQCRQNNRGTAVGRVGAGARHQGSKHEAKGGEAHHLRVATGQQWTTPPFTNSTTARPWRKFLAIVVTKITTEKIQGKVNLCYGLLWFFRGLPFQLNRALVSGERWTMAAACRGPDRWKAGNTRCWLHPPRAAFAPPAREPCSGSSGMSLGMTTDKTARNSPSQRNARFQLRSSGTRAGRRRVQAGALVRALRLQDDDARRAPAQWSCRKVET